MTPLWTLALAFLALVFGNFAFRYLERAHVFKPKARIIHEIHLLSIEALSANPYAEIDGIMEEQLKELGKKLELGQVGIQPIEIKRSGASVKTRSAGAIDLGRNPK